MSAHKLLERMARSPQSDWTLGDVKAVCRGFGLNCEKPRGGGSHYTISHPSIEKILTVPFNRPIKSVYIRHLVAYVGAVRARGDQP